MTREELEKMIDDEVVASLGSTMQEPQKPKPQPQKQAPIKTAADLSEEELDDIIFYGGKKSEYE